MYSVAETLLTLEATDHEAFMLNCSLRQFQKRFADEGSGNGEAFRGATDWQAGNYEWQRRLFLGRKGTSVDVLCCPEDVECGRRCTHEAGELCGDCRIPFVLQLRGQS